MARPKLIQEEKVITLPASVKPWLRQIVAGQAASNRASVAAIAGYLIEEGARAVGLIPAEADTTAVPTSAVPTVRRERAA